MSVHCNISDFRLTDIFHFVWPFHDKITFFFHIQERRNCFDDALIPLLYSEAPDKKFMLTSEVFFDTPSLCLALKVLRIMGTTLFPLGVI